MLRELYYRWRSRNRLRVIIYHEHGWFVAQCLEYDVCAQGKTIHDAIKHLSFAFMEIQQDGLERYHPAPEPFHKMWQDGIAEMQPRPHAKDEFCVNNFTMACAVQ